MSPADPADNRRQTPKQQNSLNLKQSVFLCEIIQLVVFLCVICAICGRITRKSTQSICIKKNNKSPADDADETIITIPGVTSYIFIGYSLFDI